MPLHSAMRILHSQPLHLVPTMSGLCVSRLSLEDLLIWAEQLSVLLSPVSFGTVRGSVLPLRHMVQQQSNRPGSTPSRRWRLHRLTRYYLPGNAHTMPSDARTSRVDSRLAAAEIVADHRRCDEPCWLKGCGRFGGCEECYKGSKVVH